jgi:geranylgeranyl diphosphate synthase type I
MQTARREETSFKNRLKADKQVIDTDIASYVDYLKASTKDQYGGSEQALKAYCDILTRGGKRLRGALVIEGYTMSGGRNQKMILQAARAIEMIHAYLLVVDDIQDKSQRRRGGPTAHVQLAKTSKDAHVAEALALNAALLGNHAAMTILANLDAPAELRTNVLSILNRTLLVTVHGQIADLTPKNVSEADVYKVQEWKTATYSILNPLHVGMVLAGADCNVTDGVTPYALAIGQAFQITDDIIGTFGDPKTTGKDLMDDIREGKQTLLTVYALNHTKPADKMFLQRCLGDPQLTATDFTGCRAVIRNSGALDYARQQAKIFVDQAIKALDKNQKYWSATGNQFLKELAEYVLVRTK